jgi:hypothetical protein
MVTIRGILPHCFLALLLAGCSNTRCPAPDALPSLDHTPCHYKLTIIDADASKGHVIGIYPSDLVREDASPNAKFVVPVTDLNTLMSQGKIVTGRTYQFTNGKGSFLNPASLKEVSQEREDRH